MRCEIDRVYACIDPRATNYDASANTDDGSCEYAMCSRAENDCSPAASCYLTAESHVCDCNEGYMGDGYLCTRIRRGCTNSTAINFNPTANVDDGSCVWPELLDDSGSGSFDWADLIYVPEPEPEPAPEPEPSPQPEPEPIPEPEPPPEPEPEPPPPPPPPPAPRIATVASFSGPSVNITEMLEELSKQTGTGTSAVVSLYEQEVNTKITLPSSPFFPQLPEHYNCDSLSCQAKQYMVKKGAAEPAGVLIENVTLNSIGEARRRLQAAVSTGVVFDLSLVSFSDLSPLFEVSDDSNDDGAGFAESFAASFAAAADDAFITETLVAAGLDSGQLANLELVGRIVTTIPPSVDSPTYVTRVEFELVLGPAVDPHELATQLEQPDFIDDVLETIGVNTSQVAVETSAVVTFVAPVEPDPAQEPVDLTMILTASGGGFCCCCLLCTLFCARRQRKKAKQIADAYLLSDEDLIAGDGQDLDEYHNGERSAGALQLIVLWDPGAQKGPEPDAAGGWWQNVENGVNRLLRVTVLKGKGLRQMDAVGENDPYVNAYLHMKTPEEVLADAAEDDPDDLEVLHTGATAPPVSADFADKTETLQEGGTAPEWGDGDGYEIQFWVPEMPGCLELRCMDEDKDADDEIGRVMIDLSGTARNRAWSRTDWVVLRQHGTMGDQPPPIRLKTRKLAVVQGGWSYLVIENAPAGMRTAIEAPRGITLLSKQETRRLALESPADGTASGSNSRAASPNPEPQPELEPLVELDDDENPQVRLQKIQTLFNSVSAGDGVYTKQAVQGFVTAEELRVGCESVGLSLIDSAVRGLLEEIWSGGEDGWDSAIATAEFEALIDMFFAIISDDEEEPRDTAGEGHLEDSQQRHDNAIAEASDMVTDLADPTAKKPAKRVKNKRTRSHMVALTAPDSPPCPGELSVTLLNCSDLIAADRNGLSDPFITVELGRSGEYTHTTAVRPKTLDPVFDETIRWNLPAQMPLQDLKLRLSVFDKDLVGDDFLGGLEVDLTTVLGEGEAWRNCRQGVLWERPLLDLDGTLQKDKEAQRQIAERAEEASPDVYGESGLGFMSIRVGFKDPTQPPPLTPPCPGVLTVNIASCTNLLAADRNGLSDPYITSHLGNLEPQKTRVQPKTLSPEFDESFRWRLEPGQLSVEDLRSFKLKLWDEDVVGGMSFAVEDDFLGEVAIDLMEELGEGASWLTQEVEWERPLTDDERLLDQDKAIRKQIKQRMQDGVVHPYGTIRLKVNFKEPSPRPSGKLQVVVLTCRGLLAADANGSSDPFVEVSVGGDPKPQRTHTVLQTLNPRFNRAEAPESKQTMFEFEMGDDVPPEQLKISASVYDWDKLSADDFLGMVEVELEKEFHAGWGHGWIVKEWPLIDSRKGDLQMGADRSVKKQIGKRRAAGLHPFGFMRLKMQFLADVPPAPTKLAIQADAHAQLGSEFPISIFVADSSGWQKEPLQLSLDVTPADAGAGAALLPPPPTTAVRNLAELRGIMGGLSRWVSVLDPNDPGDGDSRLGLLPRTSTQLARLALDEEDDDEDEGDLDIEGGGSQAGSSASHGLAVLPGMVQ